jgi:hypothetical protein
VRVDTVDPEAEGRVLAAFRAARDEGAHGVARTRRRDDWRPEGERSRRWSVRAALVALTASVTLGGVAVAAIGTGGGARDDNDERGRTRPSSSAPDTATTAAPGSSAPGHADGPSDRPSSAQDTEAQCRAYESVKDRGQVLDSAAWQRLVEAAGGEKDVEAYCARQLTEAAEQNGADKAKPGKSPVPSATAGNSSGNSSGDSPGDSPGKGSVQDAPGAKSTNGAKGKAG